MEENDRRQRLEGREGKVDDWGLEGGGKADWVRKGTLTGVCFLDEIRYS